MLFIIRLKDKFVYYHTVPFVRRFCSPLCSDSELDSLEKFLCSSDDFLSCDFSEFTVIKRPDVYFPADEI